MQLGLLAQQDAQEAQELLGQAGRQDRVGPQVAMEAQELLDQVVLLVLVEQQVAMEALAQLVLQARLALLGLLAQEEAQEAQEPLVHLAQLDPLVPQGLQAQAEGQLGPQGLLAPQALLLRLEQMAKCNTIMAALQWVEHQDFTITTLQIEWVLATFLLLPINFMFLVLLI